jgi:hypothetical protein
MRTSMKKFGIRGAVTALAIALLAPAAAWSHSAGKLDSYGCHDDRRRGGYHCHTGDMTGLKFSSKAAMLKERESAESVAEMRKAHGEGTTVENDEEGGWRSWIPFAGSKSESKEVTSGEVIVPRGIEERLRVLKNLHGKHLITDEEYEAKRKEILGEL